MHRFAYTFLYYLLLPVVLLRFLLRSIKNRAYRQRLSERFGWFLAPELKSVIWIHTVSVGEFLAAKPLIEEIKQRWPNYQLVVTTMTITGSERVKAALGDSVYHVYCPFDIPGSIQRFLKKIKPKMAIFMETELWPNILTALTKQKIPIFLANARLSKKSQQGYARLRRFTRSMLKNLTHIAVQNDEDALRFVKLGCPRGKITVSGNIKFDLNLPDGLSTQAMGLRNRLGATRPIMIAASTHAGEEAIILEVFAKLKQQHPTLGLILVPRHPERFDKVAQLCTRMGFLMHRQTDVGEMPVMVDIFLGDTMGDLLMYYGASDIAFVGGSIVPVGGHNLLEPAALGLPVVTGHHVHNFKEITRKMCQAEAAFKVENVEQLFTALRRLLDDSALAKRMGGRGQEVVAKNKGALQVHLDLLQKQLRA